MHLQFFLSFLKKFVDLPEEIWMFTILNLSNEEAVFLRKYCSCTPRIHSSLPPLKQL